MVNGYFFFPVNFKITCTVWGKNAENYDANALPLGTVLCLPNCRVSTFGGKYFNNFNRGLKGYIIMGSLFLVHTRNLAFPNPPTLAGKFLLREKTFFTNLGLR